MGLFDTIKSLLSPQPEPPYWIFVRCRRCGEVIKTGIHLRNDLSLREEGDYIVNKTLMGSSNLCFERIEVTLIFSRNRELIEQSIRGGQFITETEYETAQLST